MSWILPQWMFATLVWGALGLAGLGAAGLLVLLVQDLRSRSTW
jgi:hypothetical protein